MDPWGGETWRSSNQTFQPHRYTTYERDSNGGDEAMMRRYHSYWNRFSQPDPYDGSYNLTDPQSFNRYNYTQNDPVNFVDPTGLDGLPSIGFYGLPPWAFPPAENVGDPGGGGEMGLLQQRPVGGNPLITIPSPIPTPAAPIPQKTKAQKNKDCFERKRREIDAGREKFRTGVGKRLLWSAAWGGARGAVAGGIAGAAGGGLLFGVGAVPGAALGATVGGILGVAGGVISGGLIQEPVRRFLYNNFDYNGALLQAKKYCDAEYPY